MVRGVGEIHWEQISYSTTYISGTRSDRELQQKAVKAFNVKKHIQKVRDALDKALGKTETLSEVKVIAVKGTESNFENFKEDAIDPLRLHERSKSKGSNSITKPDAKKERKAKQKIRGPRRGREETKLSKIPVLSDKLKRLSGRYTYTLSNDSLALCSSTFYSAVIQATESSTSEVKEEVSSWIVEQVKSDPNVAIGVTEALRDTSGFMENLLPKLAENQDFCQALVNDNSIKERISGAHPELLRELAKKYGTTDKAVLMQNLLKDTALREKLFEKIPALKEQIVKLLKDNPEFLQALVRTSPEVLIRSCRNNLKLILSNPEIRQFLLKGSSIEKIATNDELLKGIASIDPKLIAKIAFMRKDVIIRLFRTEPWLIDKVAIEAPNDFAKILYNNKDILSYILTYSPGVILDLALQNPEIYSCLTRLFGDREFLYNTFKDGSSSIISFLAKLPKSRADELLNVIFSEESLPIWSKEFISLAAHFKRKDLIVNLLNRDPRMMYLLLIDMPSSEQVFVAKAIYEHLKYRYDNKDQSTSTPEYKLLFELTSNLLNLRSA